MLSLDETLRLNNEGVALFQANEPSRAAEKLHSSLIGARSLIHRRAQADQEISSNPNAPHLLQCCATSRTRACCSKDRNEFFLYLRAFAFREEPEGEGRSMQALSVYSAGILFNLAILYHTRWMKNGSPSLLDKAAVFYSTLLQIIQANDGFEHNPELLLLAFVTCNNLAQIELERGMVEDFNQHLRYMTRILYTTKRTLVVTLPTREFEGLFSNTLSAGRLSTAAAA
ncbi:unnamed protein product [Cylindrotheca closterium]|uniref:Uncharacterized protein n=1 Tax=Cylindrotheca closterium TaxID=2856 RepID=A0AAD2FML0_9STRA|nr:unnamed protein product [Cylindrotheca closterium]